MSPSTATTEARLANVSGMRPGQSLRPCAASRRPASAPGRRRRSTMTAPGRSGSTAGHPAKRLNSVNPLDPGDVRDSRSASRARAGASRPMAGRLTFRLSPLAGAAISDHLDSEGWAALRRIAGHAARPRRRRRSHGAMDQIPMKDIGRFVDAAMAMQRPRSGAAPRPFRDHRRDRAGGGPVRAREQETSRWRRAICVHDGDLAGLFEVATAASERGKGYGRRIVLSALKWARLRGAQERLAAGRGRQSRGRAGSTTAIGFRRTLPLSLPPPAGSLSVGCTTGQEAPAGRGLRAGRRGRARAARAASRGQVACRPVGISGRQGRAWRDAGRDAGPRAPARRSASKPRPPASRR